MKAISLSISHLENAITHDHDNDQHRNGDEIEHERSTSRQETGRSKR